MIVDCHVHLLQARNFDRDTLARFGLPVPTDTRIEDLISWLNEAQVDRALVMGQDATRVQNTSFGEDYVIQATEEYSDKLIGLASLEPLDSLGSTNREALKYFVNAVVDHGLRGLLLTPPFGHYYSDDRQVYPFYEKAVELDVPIQFHHSAAPGPPIVAPLKYAKISLLNDVCIDFPELRIIVEHLAYPWAEELLAMMASTKNIFADISMIYQRPTSLTWNLVMAKEYGVIDRIMYGSDYCSRRTLDFSDNPAEDFKRYIEWIRNGLNQVAARCGWPTFTEEEIKGILGENAARLYRL